MEMFSKKFSKPEVQKIFNRCPEAHSPFSKTKWQWYETCENDLPVIFCLESSLHGLKYVGQRKRHICERLVWITAFMASAITAIVLICEMFKSFAETPTVTVFHPLEANIDQIPFPGITICDLNRLKKSSFLKHQGKVLNWISKRQPGKNLSRSQLLDLAIMLDMSHICDSTLTFTNQLKWDQPVLDNLDSVNDLIEENRLLIEAYANPKATLKMVSQPCEQMILRCIWLEEVIDCKKIFQEMETDFGQCCTFNTIPHSLILKEGEKSDTNPDYVEAWRDADIHYDNILFQDDNMNRNVPYRQKYPGRTAGLSILLNPDLNEYFCSNMDSQGFIMGVHVPIDYPRMNQNGLAINANSEILVALQPDLTVSDSSIAGFSVDERECYFGNEYKLPNFNTYTMSNCILECTFRRSLEKCKCAKYNMPQSNSSTICKPKKYSCIKKVKQNILRNGLSQSCSECLPTCTEIKYRREVTHLKLDNNRFNQIIPGNILGSNRQTNGSKNVSIVHVYFNEDSAHPRLRKEMATLTQLISNAGGLLGLCVGFSVLSLLEALYFVSLRLYCTYYREKTMKFENDQCSTSKLDMNNLPSSDVFICHPKNHMACFNKVLSPVTIDRMNYTDELSILP